MKMFVFIIAFFLFKAVPAQVEFILFDSDSSNGEITVPIAYISEKGDTIPGVLLNTVEIEDGKRKRRHYKRMRKLTRNVVKVYPYAKIAGELLKECEAELLKIEDEKSRKRFMKQVEDSLRKEFEGELRKFTISQGKVLINLIDRETGHTSFKLIKDMRGGFSAFFWQSFARLFGSNLKDEYESDGEDRMIEYVIQRIERGELPVKERERKTRIIYKPNG